MKVERVSYPIMSKPREFGDQPSCGTRRHTRAIPAGAGMDHG